MEEEVGEREAFGAEGRKGEASGGGGGAVVASRMFKQSNNI